MPGAPGCGARARPAGSGQSVSARSSAVTAVASASAGPDRAQTSSASPAARSFSGNSTGRAAGQMCRRYSAPGEGSNSEI